jgi:hypothetical protein
MMTIAMGPPPRGGARRVTPLNRLTLAALFVPPAGALAGLWLLRQDPRFPWLRGEIGSAPWQLAVIVVAGGIGTAAGVADWRFHRTGQRVVGARESRAELVALAGGGAPLFALMAAATASPRPAVWLVPVVVTLLFTVVAICHDEMIFHRRACGPHESALHHTLLAGNGVAFLAWLHLVFVAGVR